MCPARRWNWDAIKDFRNISELDRDDVWLVAVDALHSEGLLRPSIIQILLQSLARVLKGVKLSGQDEREWILRNLTLKEYVLLRRSTADGKDLHVKGMSSLSLDKALILRLCWSVVDPGYDSDDASQAQKFRRGPWAGHCFDLVPVRPSSVGDTWKDVTKEILDEGLDFQGPSSPA
jgi:hypothetical protein